MANPVAISRAHLIYGVCLPLAVLLGYLLALPFESGSILVVILVLSVLSIPILMRWHHAILIFSCNAMVFPYFVPGRPMLWMIAAAMSMFFLLLNRSLGQNVGFFRARNLTYSLLFLGLVVVVTAYVTGGIGFAVFGSRMEGGKRYLSILLSIMVYFGLSTTTISPKYAKLATAVFFLSALTGLVGYFVAVTGSSFNFLVELFPVEGAVDEITNQGSNLLANDFLRLGGLGAIAIGLFAFLMSRYGLRGVLDIRKPWRIAFLALTIAMTLYSGFRSDLLLLLGIFAAMFYLEGMVRSFYFPMLLAGCLIAGLIVVPLVPKLPQAVQRTLSVLPVNVDPAVRRSAQDSTDWRVEMWKEVIPTIPRYLIKGKGYGLDPNDLDLLDDAAKGGFTKSYEESMLAGDYHNGPLSVIIPFGIFGVIAFLWFLWASIKVLRLNYLYGDPALKTINTFLLAFFVVRTVSFFFVFGSFYTDAATFAALVGLSVSLNDGVCKRPSTIEPNRPETVKNLRK